MAKTEASKSGVGVKVLGSGCVKCKTLENATREALVELGIHINNAIERLNREIRRHNRRVGSFPNGKSAPCQSAHGCAM